MKEPLRVSVDYAQAHDHDHERDVSLLAIDQALREVRFLSALSNEQETQLLEQIRRGLLEQRQPVPNHECLQVAAAARVALVERFQRLVWSIARRYRVMGRLRGFDLLDLVNEGNIGLLEVVDSLEMLADLDSSAFARRAATHIHGVLRNALRGAGMIRLPAHLAQQVQAMEQMEQRFVEEMGRKPTYAEVATEMGVSVNQVCDIEQWRRCGGVVSLEGLSTEEGEAVNTDEVGFVSLFGGVMREDGSAQASWLAAFQQTFETVLTPRQQEVLRLRYGLGEPISEVLTQGEIAARLGLSCYTTIQYYERRAKEQLWAALGSLFEDGKAA